MLESMIRPLPYSCLNHDSIRSKSRRLLSLRLREFCVHCTLPKFIEVLHTYLLLHDIQENAHAQMRAAHSRQQESLQKQKAQLDEQRGALAQLPTRKERAEVEAAAALVEQLRKDSKAKDSRHKLSVERMRRQVLVLQVCLSAVFCSSCTKEALAV